ncbi:MAG: alpha/beta fold hydrolase [archaeon]|nr:alpha/beta fold hydrolase [archaeon]
MTYNGEKKYQGEANDFICTISYEKGIYAELHSKSNSHNIGKKDFLYEGVESLSKKIADWIDNLCWNILTKSVGIDAKYFDSKNGRLAYYEYNTHLKGTPIIFLHGGPGGNSNTTRARSLKLNHPIYLYDQLGCGKSDPIPNIKSWCHTDYFNELKEFVDKMGFRKIIIIGASWGAGLAVGYATMTNCEKIESMILLSPFFSSKKWTEDQIENTRRLSDEYQKEISDFNNGIGTIENYKHFMSEYCTHFLFSQACNRENGLSAGTEEPNIVFKTLWGSNQMVCTGTMKNYNLIDSLSKINVPVQIMVGDSDEVTLKTAKLYSNLIHNSELKIVKDAGHALSFEQFESYRNNILSFLNDNR